MKKLATRTEDVRTGPRRARRLLTVLAAAALMLGFGSAAFAATMVAADAPTTVTMAPGATGTVPVTIKDTGGGFSIAAPPGTAGDGMVFTAPPNTTFPAQSTVTTQYSADGTTFGGNNYLLINCVVSNAGATLTCQPGAGNAGASSWAAGAYYRFLPQVTVSPSAPASTLLTGSSSLTLTNAAGGSLTSTVGSLNIQTPPQSGGPVVSASGLGVAGGLAAVAGLGFVGLRRRRAQGAQS